MKAVKGYTKNDYIAICKEEEGGEVFNFKSMCEAVEYIAKFLPGSSKKEAVARIINDTNCDWVFFEDESVIFRTISGNPRQFNYRDESVGLCVSAQKYNNKNLFPISPDSCICFRKKAGQICVENQEHFVL